MRQSGVTTYDKTANLLTALADKLDPDNREEAKLTTNKKEWVEPPDIVDWAHSNFVDPVTNDYIELIEHQQRLLRTALRMIWDKQVITVVYSDCKKSGKCVASDTKLKLASGDTVVAKDLIGKIFKLQSVDLQSGLLLVVSATAEDNGYQTCVVLRTSLGDTLVRTNDHPFYSVSGQWITAKKLKVGDEILFYDSESKSLLPAKIMSTAEVTNVSTVAIQTKNNVFITPYVEHNTTIAGLMGAYWATFVEAPNEVVTVANDQEQSQGRIYAAMLPTMKRLGWNVPERMPVMENYTSGSKIRAIGTNFAGEAGANQGMTLWCLDEKTKLLTRRGWKSYINLTKDDELATLSGTGHLEWQKPNEININHYEGDMLHLRHRRADVMVTPNHRLYGRVGNKHLSKDPILMEAKAAINFRQGVVQQRALWRGSQIKEVVLPALIYRVRTSKATVLLPEKKYAAADFFELLGYYLADGCMHRETVFPTRFSIAKRSDNTKEHRAPEFRLKLQACLDRMQISYTATVEGFRIVDRHLATFIKKIDQSTKRHLPTWVLGASTELLRILLDAYLLGDGEQIGTRNGWRVKSVSKKLHRQMLEAGLKTGYAVRDTSKYDKPYSSKNFCYSLTLLNTEPVWEKKQWSTEKYSGIVWCPSTDNGIVFAKRNGNCFWTGNSELWAYSSEARKRLWEEMTPVPTRRYSIRWVETYAGFLGESELLWNLYCQAFRSGEETQPLGERVVGLEDLPVWYIPTSKLLLYWNHDPRMPWQTEEYYAQQRADLRPAAFQRLHRNMWVAASDRFIDPTTWDSLEACDPLQELDDPRSIVLAADASTSNDSTALVAAYWNPDRKAPDIVGAWIWEPTGTDDVIDKKKIVDLDVLEQKIEDLISRYNVIAIYYDAFQLHSIMTKLKQKHDRMGIRKLFVNFPQSTGRVEADQAFYQFVISKKLRRIHHSKLRDHVLNAVAEESARGYRLAKEKTSNKIDGAVASSMATFGSSVRSRPTRSFIRA